MMLRCAQLSSASGKLGGLGAWPFHGRGIVVPSRVKACASRHQCSSPWFAQPMRFGTCTHLELPTGNGPAEAWPTATTPRLAVGNVLALTRSSATCTVWATAVQSGSSTETKFAALPSPRSIRTPLAACWLVEITGCTGRAVTVVGTWVFRNGIRCAVDRDTSTKSQVDCAPLRFGAKATTDSHGLTRYSHLSSAPALLGTVGAGEVTDNTFDAAGADGQSRFHSICQLADFGGFSGSPGPLANTALEPTQRKLLLVQPQMDDDC